MQDRVNSLWKQEVLKGIAMYKDISVDTKIYPSGDGTKLSMTDMLSYFERHGALRVSDLHIKIGTPPA